MSKKLNLELLNNIQTSILFDICDDFYGQSDDEDDQEMWSNDKNDLEHSDLLQLVIDYCENFHIDMNFLIDTYDIELSNLFNFDEIKNIDVILTEKQQKKYDSNEHFNNHSENVVLLAKIAGNKDLIKAAEFCLAERKKKGSLEEDIYELQKLILSKIKVVEFKNRFDNIKNYLNTLEDYELYNMCVKFYGNEDKMWNSGIPQDLNIKDIKEMIIDYCEMSDIFTVEDLKWKSSIKESLELKILSFKDFINEKTFIPNPNIKLSKKSPYFSQDDDVFKNDENFKFEDRKSTGAKFCTVVKDRNHSWFSLYLDQNKVGLEYYSGENYTVGSYARSHSRRFDVKDIPKAYQNQFKEMVKAFEYHFKIDLSQYDSNITKYYDELKESLNFDLQSSLNKVLKVIKLNFSIDGGNNGSYNWKSKSIFKGLKNGPDLFRNLQFNDFKSCESDFLNIVNAYEKNKVEINKWFESKGFKLENGIQDDEVIIELKDDYIEKFYKNK